MRLISTRDSRIRGRAYRPGEAVDTQGVRSDKVGQLIDRHILRDADLQAPSSCVALRDLSVNGKRYKRGEAIDIGGLHPLKVSQMLEHRMIDLAQRASSDVRQAKRVAK